MAASQPLQLPHSLLLIRHGPPEIDPERAATQWPLSPESRSRCLMLFVRFAHVPVDRVISSEEPKARETAHLLAEQRGVPVESHPGLNEQRRDHHWLDDAAFRDAVRTVLRHPTLQVFNAETGEAARQRFATTVADISARYPGEALALVSHGTVLSLFLSQLIDEPADVIWDGMGFPAAYCVSGSPPRLSLRLDTLPEPRPRTPGRSGICS